MTQEKASEVLEMFLHKQCDLKRTEFAYTQNEVFAAVNMAAEALEKQIPKKVRQEAVNSKKHTCPNCKTIVERLRKVNNGRNTVLCIPAICPHCGQALKI